MVFVLGLLIGILGFALLLLGDTPLSGGRRLPAARARLIGGALVSFFPVALLARYALSWIESGYVVYPQALYWSILVLCAAGAVVPHFRALFPRRAPRTYASSSATSFDDVKSAAPADAPALPWQEPHAPLPAPKKKGRAAAPQKKNPFDFS